MHQAPAKPSVAEHRRGFTLVELLVVMAIMGMLIALLLPAIQAARGAARRVSCLNNLRQIGIGLCAYHDALKTFPIGSMEHRNSWDFSNPNAPQYIGSNGRQLAWSAFLLPFIEQGNIQEMLDLNTEYDSDENAEGAARVLSVYICPSNPRSEMHFRERAVCDYGGIYGARLLAGVRYNHTPNGTMLYNETLSIRDVVDGTSNTMMVSEDGKSTDMQWINGANVFRVRHLINDGPLGENEICSTHIGGGAHGLFCDGSVRYLSEEMAREILSAICTRDEGEIAGDF